MIKLVKNAIYARDSHDIKTLNMFLDYLLLTTDREKEKTLLVEYHETPKKVLLAHN